MKYVNCLDGRQLESYLIRGMKIAERIGDIAIIECNDDDVLWLINRLWSGLYATADTRGFDSIEDVREFYRKREQDIIERTQTQWPTMTLR